LHNFLCSKELFIAKHLEQISGIGFAVNKNKGRNSLAQ